jgi:DnaK suppressor protein
MMKNESLSPAQRETLRRALEAKRSQILRDLEQREAEAAEGEVDSAELEDVAEGVIEDRERASLEEHDRELLEEVERALAKLDAGSYGISEASGRPISFERLQSVPWTRYDVGEAERVEHGSRA